MPQSPSPARATAMTTPDTKAKLGIYGKGSYDVTKARVGVKKALEDAAGKFSKAKAYNCTVQPQPPQPKPEAAGGSSKFLGTLGKVAVQELAKKGGKPHQAEKDDHPPDATGSHRS